MKKYIFTSQFKRDIKRAKKVKKNLVELERIMRKLAEGEILPPKNKDHKLLGGYRHYRECHIQPNFLLIYKINQDNIIFERVGSHSELFE